MTSTHRSNGVVASTARIVEKGLVATRKVVSQLFDNLQLRLRAIDISRDPQVKEWTARMRSTVQRGDIDRILKQQPEDPRTLIDRRRPSSS